MEWVFYGECYELFIFHAIYYYLVFILGLFVLYNGVIIMNFNYWLELGFTAFVWLVVLFLLLLMIFFVKEVFLND